MIMHRSALQLPRLVAFILRSCAIGAVLGAGLAVAGALLIVERRAATEPNTEMS